MNLKCNAITSRGGKCRLPAGHQTIHFGVGRCKFHEETNPEFPYKYSSKKIATGHGMCRSPRELRMFRYLDRSKRIYTYLIEPYCLKYFYEGELLTYMPDLLVEYSSGIRKLVEIKTESDFIDKRNIAKYRAAVQFVESQPDIQEFVVWIIELKKDSSKTLTNKLYNHCELSLSEVLEKEEEHFQRLKRWEILL